MINHQLHECCNKILDIINSSPRKMSIKTLSKKAATFDIWLIKEAIWDLAAADKITITNDWKLKKYDQ